MHNELTFEWVDKDKCANDYIKKTLVNNDILWCYDPYMNVQADIYHCGKESAITYFCIKGDTYGIITKPQWRAIKAIREAGVNNVFVRPTYKGFGVYHSIGINRAEVIFEAVSKQECDDAVQITRIWGDKEVDY